jgi:hypothetical protein
MFRKLFGKNDKKSKNQETQENSKHSEIRMDLSELIEKSTIQIMTHQLFMHHQKNDLIDNPNDPAWKNQAIYFWKGNEKFERKSLPPEFREYEKHYFIVNGVPKELQLNHGKAMPWFGMEGNGDKYFFSFNGAEVRLKELAVRNIIQYVQTPQLNMENVSILNDRENYFWLMDTEMIGYENNSFQYNGNPISISKAYELGGLRIIGIEK